MMKYTSPSTVLQARTVSTVQTLICGSLRTNVADSTITRRHKPVSHDGKIKDTLCICRTQTGSQLPHSLCHVTGDVQRPQPWQDTLTAFPGQRSEPAGCTKVREPWSRATEGSDWTERLVLNTTAPQRRKDQTQSASRLLVTVKLSAAQGFHQRADEVSRTFPWQNKNTCRLKLGLWTIGFSLRSRTACRKTAENHHF